jgi:hypothetical protein
MDAQRMDTRIDTRIARLIADEIAALDPSSRADRLLLAEFESLRDPNPTAREVQFSGGLTQMCWRVTRSNGAYSLFYLPGPDYFSLCVDSAIGPLDIGVHGPALRCFASV